MGNGKAAMDLMGQWAPGAFADNSVDKKGLGDKAGWFPFPTVEGGAGGPADALGGGNGWTVGKNAPPEAVDFLKYISSVDSQRAQAEIGLSVPVVKGAEDALADPLPSDPIFRDEELVGYVTSASPGFRIGKRLALGYVRHAMKEHDARFEVEVFGRRCRAVATPMPFYDPTNTRLRS